MNEGLAPDRIVAAPIVLAPGELVVAAAGPRIVTVLGSCVAICLRDRVAGLAGMNHFRLAGTFDGSEPPPELAGSYAPSATLALVRRMLARGARTDRLEAKVFGGGRLLGLAGGAISDANVRAADRLLAALAIPVVARDVGGTRSRRIELDTESGEVLVTKVRPRDATREER